MLLIEKILRNTADIQFTKLCKISQENAGNLKGISVGGKVNWVGVIHVELSFKLKYTRIAPSQKKIWKAPHTLRLIVKAQARSGTRAEHATPLNLDHTFSSYTQGTTEETKIKSPCRSTDSNNFSQECKRRGAFGIILDACPSTFDDLHSLYDGGDDGVSLQKKKLLTYGTMAVNPQSFFEVLLIRDL